MTYCNKVCERITKVIDGQKVRVSLRCDRNKGHNATFHRVRMRYGQTIYPIVQKVVS